VARDWGSRGRVPTALIAARKLVEPVLHPAHGDEALHRPRGRGAVWRVQGDRDVVRHGGAGTLSVCPQKHKASAGRDVQAAERRTERREEGGRCR
jgi:hypothetical protein